MSVDRNIKALIFDVFGTCVDWRAGVAREALAFGQSHGIGGIDGAAFADAWRALHQPQMEEVRSGRARPNTAPARPRT